MKERLIEFLAYLGMGQNAFEKKVGISNGTISKMEKGMRSDNLANIAKTYPELDLRWLLLGEGNMINREKSLETEQQKQIAELTDTVALLRDVVKDMRSQIAELKLANTLQTKQQTKGTK